MGKTTNILFITLLSYIFRQARCNLEKQFRYPYQFDSGYNNREELIITKVESGNVLKPDSNETVVRWKSLSINEISYGVGISNSGLTLLKAKKDNEKFHTDLSFTSLNSSILDATIFPNYNKQLQIHEIIVLASVTQSTYKQSTELIWFKVSEDNKLEQFWKWNTGKIVEIVKCFNVDGLHNVLLVGKNEDNDNNYVDLYQFNLCSKDFWLKQSIPLENPIHSLAITNHYENTYLSIPQEKLILIFKHNGATFNPYKNIPTNNTSYIVSFKIASNSYLATSGTDTAIYNFSNFHRINTDLNNVDFWLPITTSKSGDEKIVIAEKILNHGSHTSYNIEGFVNNGDNFELHEEMKCDYHGEVSNGLDCIVEESSTLGIKGSAVIYVEGLIGILIPKENSHSELFLLHTEIKDIKSPIENKISQINQMKKEIENRLKTQKQKYQEIGDSLKYVLKDDEENIISAPWKVENLNAAVFTPKNLQVISRSNENPINLNKLKERIIKIEEKITLIKEKLLQMQNVSGNYINIVFKRPVEVQGESSVRKIQTNKFNSENVTDIFSDIVRINNLHEIPSQKSFQSINVENLNFNTINGIPAENLAYSDIHPLKITGDIFFNEPVLVEGNVLTEKVNDIKIEDSWVQVDEIYNGTFEFNGLNIVNTLSTDIANKFPIHKNYMNVNEAGTHSNIEEEVFKNLFIAGNLTVETINGENLNELIHELCLRNINNTYIPGTTKIEGEIIVDGMVRANYLNQLKFPEEYIRTSSEGFSKISGKKIFNEVFIKELTTEKLNNVNPDNIVTFSADQDLPGKFVFNNLKVTETLEILGELDGTHINKIESNALITETNTIKSNVNFKNLEVDGNIIISSGFNGTDLEEILNNIVYKFENPVEITSVKEFPQGFTSKKNTFLQSNTINNIPINNFVSKQKDQLLEIRTLNGDVSIDNLYITGTIGGINVTKLDEETVRLSGEQFISSRIILEDQIIIKELQILETLNDISHEDYLYSTSNNSLNLGSFDEILVGNLEIRDNLNGNLLNFNLSGFMNTRMSYTLDQVITEDFTIENSTIQNFNTTLINNYQFNKIFDDISYSIKIFELLYSGKLKVEELLVKDALKIDSINGIPMSKILNNCLTSEENLFKSELSLMDVNFSNLKVDYFNDVKFSEIIENLVFKNESLEKINGHKIYLNGFDVLNYIDTDKLNGIRINNILRKNGVQRLEAPLVIDGNVILPNHIQVLNGFNGVSLEKVMDVFNSPDDGTYIIKDDVMFKRRSYINELVVENYVNEENLTDFLENIIDINENAKIYAPTIFKKYVKIEGNVVVNQKINNIEVENLKENIVLITQDGIVEGLVKFKNPVVVNDELTIDGNLVNQFVMGIDLNSWKTNATFIDQGLLEGSVTFEEGTVNKLLETEFLNQINTKSLIPLNTDQLIEESLYFDNISSFNDVIVNNFVNSLKLLPELENTVMKNKIQEINSNVVFDNNVLIENNLWLLGQINGYSPNKMVTTNVPQNLTAAYNFKEKVTIRGDVEVSGLINGVDMKEWLINGVVKENLFPQFTSQPWIVKQNVTFNNNVISGGNISGLEAYVWANEVEDKVNFMHSTQESLQEQYLNICGQVKSSTELVRKNLLYKFKYFDFHQFIDVDGIIETTYNFEHLENQFLIVSNKNNCISTIFFWEYSEFVPFIDISTGSVEQIISVHINNYTFLVTRGAHDKYNCGVEGSNIWNLETNHGSASLLYKIDDTILLQESKIPGTFYAMFSDSVVEYRIEAAPEPIVTKIRKWVVPTENSAFIPHGLNIGLALRTGKKIFYLKRNDSEEDNVTLGYDYSSLVMENFTEIQSSNLPGYSRGEVTILKVGQPRRKHLVAVTSNEVTTIPNSVDLIKIYEDPIRGKIFHKLPSHKPSSLISIEFAENGETLLVFIENNMKLKIFEYRGVEGFKYRSSADLQGEKLLSLKLPLDDNKRKQNFICVVNKNQLTIIRAVMDGAQPPTTENLKCLL